MKIVEKEIHNDEFDEERSNLITPLKKEKRTGYDSNDKFNLKELKLKAWNLFLISERKKMRKKIKIDLMNCSSEKKKEKIGKITLKTVKERNIYFYKCFFINTYTKKKKFLDHFIILLIIYISSLVDLEKVKYEYNEAKENELKEKMKMAKAELKEKTKLSSDHLTRLSFQYSKIIQEINFNGKLLREISFFEAFYFIVQKICCFKFESNSIHHLIETEIYRLLKTKHYLSLPKSITGKKLYLDPRNGYNINNQSLKAPCIISPKFNYVYIFFFCLILLYRKES